MRSRDGSAKGSRSPRPLQLSPDFYRILIGDPKQLPAVEAGGMLAALAARVEPVSLVENRRQRDPEERVVVASLRAGHTTLAVRRLEEHDRATLAHNSDELRDQMVLDW
jgi:ATP-dependent exoDNAse (exonuclease V) alpha subunit